MKWALALAGFAAFAQKPPLAEIPLKIGDNYRLDLTARINDTEFACSLDSGGGDRIYLDRSRAEAANIQATRQGQSAGPRDGTMNVDARAVVTLEIGDVKLTGQELVMQNRPYAAYACVIGLSVLKQYVVEIDYEAPALRVYEAASFPPAERSIPFTMEQGNPFVTVNLDMPIGAPLQARMSVDTGGGRPAAYLTKTFIDRHDVMSRVIDAAPDAQSGSSGGQPRVLAAHLEKLTVGSTALARPLVFLWQVKGFGGSNEPDGLLCPGFLSRYKVTFDYPRRMLILAPAARAR